MHLSLFRKCDTKILTNQSYRSAWSDLIDLLLLLSILKLIGLSMRPLRGLDAIPFEQLERRIEERLN